MTPARPIEDFAADPLALYRRGLAQSHRGECFLSITLENRNPESSPFDEDD